MAEMVNKLCSMSKKRVILSFAPNTWYYSLLKKVRKKLLLKGKMTSRARAKHANDLYKTRRIVPQRTCCYRWYPDRTDFEFRSLLFLLSGFKWMQRPHWVMKFHINVQDGDIFLNVFVEYIS